MVTPFLCAFVTALSFFYTRLSTEELNAASNAFTGQMPALVKAAQSQRGYPTLRRIRGESEALEDPPDTNKQIWKGRGEEEKEERSKTEGLIFIHIPKAAGFTWRRLLHQV